MVPKSLSFVKPRLTNKLLGEHERFLLESRHMPSTTVTISKKEYKELLACRVHVERTKALRAKKPLKKAKKQKHIIENDDVRDFKPEFLRSLNASLRDMKAGKHRVLRSSRRGDCFIESGSSKGHLSLTFSLFKTRVLTKESVPMRKMCSAMGEREES